MEAATTTLSDTRKSSPPNLLLLKRRVAQCMVKRRRRSNIEPKNKIRLDYIGQLPRRKSPPPRFSNWFLTWGKCFWQEEILWQEEIQWQEICWWGRGLVPLGTDAEFFFLLGLVWEQLFLLALFCRTLNKSLLLSHSVLWSKRESVLLSHKWAQQNHSIKGFRYKIFNMEKIAYHLCPPVYSV